MKKIFISIVLLFLMTNCVYAADNLFRFTHNDHDVLIVGTIKEIDENKIKADVSKTIVSTAYLNQINKNVQLNPSSVVIDISNLRLDTEFKTGDFILASLDKTLFDYKVANGLYKVTSDDIKTLKVVVDDKDRNLDVIAIEYFVNSNGVINEFSFSDNSIKFIDPNGEEITLYNKEDEKYEETLELEDRAKLQEVLAKDYYDAMVVTILLTAGIMIVIVLTKSRIKTND